MPYKIKLQQFEGPLDLLLQLIEEQKMQITQISLAEVTEQYIGYLQEAVSAGRIVTEELADFLVVAAKLLLIKSKALLPYLQWGNDDESRELERQLKIYKEYLEASKTVSKIIGRKKFSYSREKLLTFQKIGFNPPKSLNTAKLSKIFADILYQLKPLTLAPVDVIRKTVNIQEKIAHIRQSIYEKATMNFTELLKDARDKTEIIVSFLALLELIKQRTIFVHQENLFEEIKIEKID
ncbi:hypothetical protein C4569_00615 [Candidatus Parcubacteria bacterium]|nr:MAG: hypothetical protein C4569_00615 [Candidatus Parcubacteria bacterium]